MKRKGRLSSHPRQEGLLWELSPPNGSSINRFRALFPLAYKLIFHGLVQSLLEL